MVGSYGHDETVGYMVGYVEAGSLSEVLAKINQQIVGHPSMGVVHQLEPLHGNSISSWNRSSHLRVSGRLLNVDHLLIDVS